MTGSLTMNGQDILLKTSGSSSDDAADIVWFYGNGQEKARIWTDNSYSSITGPYFRTYKSDGTLLREFRLPVFSANPTSGQVVITDGTNGAIKTSGYTIAKSVPSDAVFTDHYAWSDITSKPTTISGYGITDAKIASGTITLGSNTITPLTSSSTLNAAKLSGEIPIGCYTALDVTGASGIAASKTISAWSQTDGKISITTQNISITKSQVSDFPTSMTPTSHTHGNIQNGGTLQTNDITIASGDKLVVTDSSDSSKIARTSVSFDGSTTTKALTQKGRC